MGITKDSPLIDVFAESKDDFVPLTTDLNEWTTLKPFKGDDLFTTVVGLFGAELNDFLSNCAKATEKCNVADYDNYSGWAIGIEWTVDEDTDKTFGKTGVVFEDQSILVMLNWVEENPLNRLRTGSFEVDVADDAPLFDDLIFNNVTLDEYGRITYLMNPFLNFFGELKPPEDKLQYAIHFQDSTAETYYEVGSEATLWTTDFDGPNGVATDVTFGGAATLTAAAGAILASLIF